MWSWVGHGWSNILGNRIFLSVRFSNYGDKYPVHSFIGQSRFVLVQEDAPAESESYDLDRFVSE